MIALAPETETLIRTTAEKTGKTHDQVICEALAAANPDVQPRRKIDRVALAKLLAELDALPVRDNRSAKEILDEAWGL